mmetsp:Transcript_108174/g.312610  ORF Transcript_108174/g.312610 Transcript_108174/m.312610 type:complete len:225 (-) Transcript_108174:206-880(-)
MQRHGLAIGAGSNSPPLRLWEGCSWRGGVAAASAAGQLFPPVCHCGRRLRRSPLGRDQFERRRRRRRRGLRRRRGAFGLWPLRGRAPRVHRGGLRRAGAVLACVRAGGAHAPREPTLQVRGRPDVPLLIVLARPPRPGGLVALRGADERWRGGGRQAAAPPAACLAAGVVVRLRLQLPLPLGRRGVQVRLQHERRGPPPRRPQRRGVASALEPQAVAGGERRRS